jgi:rare lipoprotein A
LGCREGKLLVKSGVRQSVVFLILTLSLTVFPQTISMVQNAPIAAPVPLQNLRYGIASWYSESDPYINLHTANGEVFDDSKLTCAAWSHKFGTRLNVTNLANGKTVTCRVNDRGPAKRLGRLIDLTKTAFREIALLRSGLVRVSVAVTGSQE